MPYSTPKKSVKEVRYLNKDFTSFKENLIEFSKIYFPREYNDFNESSPGMMFIEMASYVGDVLSYYIDNQFKESLLAFAEEKRTVYNMAQSLGYKPKLATPATAILDIYQTVPADVSGTGEDTVTSPDLDYAFTVKEGMELISDSGITFTTQEDCNFSFESISEPKDTTIYESNVVPVTYLLKKSVKVVSGEVSTDFFTFNTAEKYKRIALSNSNVTEIISCTDSDGNDWYEVPFLAQDTVFTDMENTSQNDDELYAFADQAPYLLKLLKTTRRFTTFIREDGKTELRFGAGTSDSPDEEIVPNPDEVGSSLPGSPSKLGQALDPSNFLDTKAYGQAPSNTQLTITYRHGGGVEHNVISNSIRSIQSSRVVLDETGLSSVLVSSTRNSIAVNNPLPASGGRGAQSVIEVKNNTLSYFQAQQRAVTKEDYITRVYALPPKYGNVSKAYIVQDSQLDVNGVANQNGTNRIENPLALNLYVLGYDSDKKLSMLNKAVKENIQTYLTQFRMVTDAVNIKDAFVINIGVNFDLLTKVGYNKEEVVLRAIQEVQSFFDIDKWQIGQPIVLADLAYRLSLVDGVSAVVPPESNNPNNLPVSIVNKYKESDGYSGNLYDINAATKEGIIFPSLDPSCFELKFSSDIQGRVVGDSAGGN
jgi:hypothetical protein|tara:strand:- start:2669 stop:4618 length:1950 start_codon:yes stop_codon:yes gene_type:complete